jgi:hypothetical protein
MWLNLSIILGTCLAGVAFGFFVYWIIIKVQETLRTNRSRPTAEERPPQSIIKENTDDYSSEQPLNEVDYAQDITRKAEDDDWLNSEEPDTSASSLRKDDADWLNSGAAEAPSDISKQDDDAWLMGEGNQSLEAPDESLFNPTPTNSRDIQIKRDGSIININVTASRKRDITPQRTVINLKIHLSPQGSTRKGEWPYDMELPASELSPSMLILQDIVTIKSLEEPVSHSLLMDEVSIKPMESQVVENHALMDEVTVRSVESPVIETPRLMDDISVRPVESQDTESQVLMDEIAIRPSSGPVHIEYELLDDLITKSAAYRTKKATPTVNEAIASPVESPVERAEPRRPIRVNEIAEVFRDKTVIKRAAIPSIAAESRRKPFLAMMSEGIVSLSKLMTIFLFLKLLGGIISLIGLFLIISRVSNTSSIIDGNLGFPIALLGLTLITFAKGLSISSVEQKKQIVIIASMIIILGLANFILESSGIQEFNIYFVVNSGIYLIVTLFSPRFLPEEKRSLNWISAIIFVGFIFVLTSKALDYLKIYF